MQALLDVILPVFLVIGFGYLSVRRGWFPASGAEGVMAFAQNFAIPVLLFQALSTLDLGQSFDPALLGSFYVGAASGFAAGFLGARYLFGRPLPDAVAIGFCCLFSNSVLLGLPITERAFGPEALTANFGIIAIHAPFCYFLGVTVMETVANRGGGVGRTLWRITRSFSRNPLIIGIGLGLVVNLSGLPLPGIVTDAVALIATAGLPAALFALGGILTLYRPEGDGRVIAMICVVSLLVHPAITAGLGVIFGLERDAFRSAVLTAAMAPGVNTYLFANMYGAARRVAATSVLVATALSVGTIWVWLLVLA